MWGGGGRWIGILACAGLIAGCSLRGHRYADSGLRARRLMVPVAGVAPSQVQDTFNAPRDRIMTDVSAMLAGLVDKRLIEV